MIVELKNFGALREARLEMAPLTLLCGANNTSKTYAMYAVYGLLRSSPNRGLGARRPSEAVGIELAADDVTKVDLEEYFREHWKRLHRRISEQFQSSLDTFFSTDSEAFASSSVALRADLDKSLDAIRAHSVQRRLRLQGKVVVEITKEAGSLDLSIAKTGEVSERTVERALSEILSRLSLLPWSEANQVLLPAERGGLNLFFQELNARRTALFHHATTPQLDLAELLKDVTVSRYPQPIADYIDLLNDMGNARKRKSEFHDTAVALQKEVLGGSYVVASDATVSFKPRRSKQTLGLHLGSSTVKNLFGLWFYLEHMARKGDVLMIDEPELNLHPDNQRLIARILVRLVGLGHRVVVSTHSDYLVREVNNLIVLSHDFPEREALRQKFGYGPEDAIAPDLVRAYHFHDGTATAMEISPSEGIIAETFDRVINDLNNSTYEIASAWATSQAPTEEGSEE